MGTNALLDESLAIAAFKQQLGIHFSEEAHFGWIAEVGLQSPLPPRWQWTAHSDAASGFVYYVDHDRQVSSWENPLVPFLRRVVEIGRNYLHCLSEGYFEEQKGSLWHEHKHELDRWHGPFTDDEGRPYYVNSTDGVSSWQDPRIDAQYIFELESGLLTSLEEVLPLPQPDTPGFGPDGEPARTQEGAEVLQLEKAPRNNRKKKTVEIGTLAQKTAEMEHKTIMEQMSGVAERLRGMQLDEEEAQRLQLSRKVAARRHRRGTTPPAQASRISQALVKSAFDSSNCQKIPSTHVPPPPPHGFVKEQPPPCASTVYVLSENVSPPASLPQLTGKPMFHGSNFANLTLTS